MTLVEFDVKGRRAIRILRSPMEAYRAMRREWQMRNETFVCPVSGRIDLVAQTIDGEPISGLSF